MTNTWIYGAPVKFGDDVGVTKTIAVHGETDPRGSNHPDPTLYLTGRPAACQDPVHLAIHLCVPICQSAVAARKL